MFGTDINISIVELWRWLFFAAFLFLVGYFVFKLWIRPAEEPQIDPERTFTINGQKYKFVKVEDEHNVAS